MEQTTRKVEIFSAIKWYFDIKNLSLKNAISLRCPLSIEDQKDLRQYYSQYFVGLLSAIELLLQREYKNKLAFKKSLEMALVFESFTDGAKNYSYLRELRNSIIHRGLDISSSAHIENDFPLIIAPQHITNRSGAVSHNPFGYYLIDIIQKCERIIGRLVLTHFRECNLLEMNLYQEDAAKLSKKFIYNSKVLPDWVKEVAIASVCTINHEDIHNSLIDALIESLELNVLHEKKSLFQHYPVLFALFR